MQHCRMLHTGVVLGFSHWAAGASQSAIKGGGVGVVFTPRAGTHPSRIPPLPVPRGPAPPVGNQFASEQDHDTIIPHRDQC